MLCTGLAPTSSSNAKPRVIPQPPRSQLPLGFPVCGASRGMKQNVPGSDLFCKCNLETPPPPPPALIQHFQLSAAGFVVDASKKRGISGIIYSYKDWHIDG